MGEEGVELGEEETCAQSCDTTWRVNVGDQGLGAATSERVLGGPTPLGWHLHPSGASHRGIPSSPALWDVHPARARWGTASPPQQALTGTRAQRVPTLCVPRDPGSSLLWRESA